LFDALNFMRGVDLRYFLQTDQRRTFTYCKPLVLHPGKPPRELNRLDTKNWSPTPQVVSERIVAAFDMVSFAAAVIIMDQVDLPETGVVTTDVLKSVCKSAIANPHRLMIADSRRGLKDYPPVCLKMNERELSALAGATLNSLDQIKSAASSLARTRARPVFVTLAERGIVGADASGTAEYVPAFPVHGEIDIVGAGDAVTANLTATLAAGAALREALEMAMAAASIVIHQLGTTGTAGVEDIRALLFSN
jgi:bifunctional ADP-heptose synthase (sugar kinase/adenylyltransferase)